AVSGYNNRKRPVTLRISKIKEYLFVVVFQEKGGRARQDEAVPADTQRIEETAIHQLESELAATRQDLQSHIEQLKSLNEELQSSNEELQAANEELETSREELQSLNEELVTVNSQLQGKIEEQEETNNDLNNFLASTNIPTIFLDDKFRVRRYTPAMLKLIKLLPSDVGRPNVDMSQENLGSDLIGDTENVLESLVPVKREIRINGTWYVRTTLPYRTGDSRIAGVVVTYNDVTELKIAEERTLHLASFPQFNPSPVLEVNTSGSITYSNAATQKVLASMGLAKDQATIFLPHDIDGILRDLQKGIEETHTREVAVGERIFGETIYVAPQFSTVRIYAFDVTERKRAERVMLSRLRVAEASYKSALAADEVLRLTLDELEIQTGSRIGFFHFLEEDQETLSLQNWSTNTVATMCSAEGKGRHYNISQAGVWVDCVREKRPVIHNDYSSLPHKKGMPEGHAPVVREMVVPIFRGGRIVAIIGVGNKETDYTKSDIEIATYLGDFAWEIVERKKAEEALRESEERLGLFIAHAPAALAMFDRDMRYLSFSRRWMSDYGLGDRDLRGLSHYEVFPEISEEWKVIHRRALAGEVVRNDNDRFDRADGTVQWLRWEARPWYDAAGTVAGIVVFSEDITEGKKAEELIGRLAAIVESADDAIISKDLNGVVQSWNIGAEKIFGYTAAEAVGRNISLLIPPGHADETPEVIMRILRGEHIEHFESVRLHKDGTVIPVSLTYSAIRDANGKVTGISKIAHDITERRRAEEQLARSNQKINEILESIQDDFYVLDRDWNFVYASRKFTSMMGKEPKDFVGENFWEMFPKHRGTVLEENLRAAMNTREIRRFETGGKYTNAWYRMTVFPSAEGVTVLGTDVTERKKAEEALRQSEERYRLLFGNLLDGFAFCKMLFDEDGRPVDFVYLGVNNAFTRLTGLADVVGKRVTEVIPGIREAEPELFEIYGRVALTGRPERFEIEFKPLGMWLSISVYSPQKEHFVAVFDDITTRKRAEEEIRKHIEELQAANEELARFNRAAVDRELRMIELKKEVNACLSENGRPPRYPLDFEKGKT
ncbi:MAG TPA: PAS domain S-box protein, partial [Nitrospirota bacterium]|nr:PAS domain S-box protein [Nitrospirota bacterium]